MSRTSPPLLARGLRKRYGDTVALDGLDLEVQARTVHALLGPNGAGKSTAINVFTTLTRFDDGEVRVAGHDVRREHGAVRAAIGLVGQSAAVDEILFGRENLVMFARLHGLTRSEAEHRAAELLESFALAEAADHKVSTYSGGMRRRLDIAAALITRPRVLFLDEPTTGLDPRGRHEVWRMVRQVVAAGTSVLLTTQYLDEADQLADRITVLARGRVLAEGTAAELKDRIGGDRVIITVPAATDLETVRRAVRGSADPDARQVVVEAGAGGGSAALISVVHALDAAGLEIDDLLLRRPTLDEVFLALTAPGATTESEPDAAHRPTEGAAR